MSAKATLSGQQVLDEIEAAASRRKSAKVEAYNRLIVEAASGADRSVELAEIGETMDIDAEQIHKDIRMVESIQRCVTRADGLTESEQSQLDELSQKMRDLAEEKRTWPGEHEKRVSDVRRQQSPLLSKRSQAKIAQQKLDSTDPNLVGLVRQSMSKPATPKARKKTSQ